MPLKHDDLPLQYIDGWMANKNNVLRVRNPYDLRAQFGSHEAWTEGWTARQYAVRNNEDTQQLDDFTPRFST